jgi:S1-C subfamily serine protease
VTPAPRRRPPPAPRDEEGDRPRKKQQPKQGGSLLPLVLIGGGVLLLLAVVIGGVAWLLYSGTNKADQAARSLQQNVVAEKEQLGAGGQAQEPEEPAVLPAELAAAKMTKIKEATAYLRVDLPTGGSAEGSGFFAMERGIVITNAHVLGMLRPDSQPPRSVAVMVNSGEANEKKHTGLLLGVDRRNDLAVLRVDATGGPLPEPLAVETTGRLSETQKVYIFGFPLGAELGKNITVSQSSISSLRKDETGTLSRIQVNGGMHPGNSGGPVTDSRGVVVGVSVSGIPGTQLNFAIPGAFVKQVFNGRIDGSELGRPFASDSGALLPVRLTTLDPLNRARDVKVEVWAGSPGKPRPASLAKPRPQPGDGERQAVAALGRDGKYAADVPLPRLGSGQVYWVQPVLVNATGATQWGQAVSYSFDPARVLQRKGVVLQYKVPEKPIERTIKLTSNEAKTLYLGDKSLSSSEKVDGYVLESVQPTTSPLMKGQGTRTDLTLARPTFTKEDRDSKRVAPPQLGTYVSRFSPAFVVDGTNTAKQRVTPRSFDAVPALYRETVQDLFETVLNTWELTTIPLPNRLIEPGKDWPGVVPMMVSVGKKKEVYRLYLTCTYEGTWSAGGRQEASIRLSGVVKGPKERGEVVLGKVSGHTVFDIDGGFHREVKVLITIEPDTENSKLRVLVTDERTVTREDGNTQGIKRATAPGPGPGPPGPGGNPQLVVGGTAAVGRAFSLTARLPGVAPGTMITLNVPPGLSIVGPARKMVPPTGSVTWNVRATSPGLHKVTATLGTGKTLEWQLPVRPAMPKGPPRP